MNTSTQHLNLSTLAVDPDAVSVRSLTPREERGIALSLSGAVHAYGERQYVVTGSTGTRYLLSSDGRRFTCDCPDFSRYGERPRFVCKHGAAVAHAIEHGLASDAWAGYAEWSESLETPARAISNSEFLALTTEADSLFQTLEDAIDEAQRMAARNPGRPVAVFPNEGCYAWRVTLEVTFPCTPQFMTSRR